MLSIFFSLLVVNNGFQVAYIKLNEVQAIEVVDIDDNSGILTITLKGDKEDIAFKCKDKDDWHQTKEFLQKSQYALSKEMTKADIDISYKYKEEF